MSTLFSPFRLRDVTFKNRTALSPMCQYSARHGLANDWHFAHLARFAIGGFGLVMVEAAAVLPEGRISYGDLGLWSDEQIAPLARIVDFLHSQGAMAGIQIAHAGRKGSSPLWWRGSFNETEEEKPEVAFEDWQPVAPSALSHMPANKDYKIPKALSLTEIHAVRDAFIAAAVRAGKAGFDVVEIHGAHGYLINQFLSPFANRRDDDYGGSAENRMRLILEIAEGVRAVWPDGKPLFVRLSVREGVEGGRSVADNVELARRLKACGVDLVDCSSGGFDGAKIQAEANYQVPLAAEIRAGADIPTMTVGLITDPLDAEAILARGDADLIALGRGALDDPQWPLHAADHLGFDGDRYAIWPKQAGFAVRNKDRALNLREFAEGT
jgi:2,4-dienoyl-CoA reductase-like NADH-dependent reductase (Old Yellow Enzyme family)